MTDDVPDDVIRSVLSEMGEIKPEAVADAIKRYKIDPERPSPLLT